MVNFSTVISVKLYRLEPENGLKMEIALQSTFDPIQPKAKKTFISTVCSINQANIVRNNAPKPLANHLDISQAGSNRLRRVGQPDGTYG